MSRHKSRGPTSRRASLDSHTTFENRQYRLAFLVVGEYGFLLDDLDVTLDLRNQLLGNLRTKDALSGQDARPSFAQGFHTHSVIEAAHQSAIESRWVRGWDLGVVSAAPAEAKQRTRRGPWYPEVAEARSVDAERKQHIARRVPTDR